MVSLLAIADIIKKLAEVVKSTRDIIDAVNDGRKFLAKNFPQAQPDFSNLIEQMKKTIVGMAEVTSVISGFRFSISANMEEYSAANGELARFNDYIIKQKAGIADLKNNIRQLKSDCEKIKYYRDELDKRSRTKSWGSLFGLLGDKAEKRSQELHGPISNFYTEDQRMLDLFNETLDLTEQALQDVEQSLGPPGMANPYNVPTAASVLGTYAKLFESPNKELHKLADVMSDVKTSLLVPNTG